MTRTGRSNTSPRWRATRLAVAVAAVIAGALTPGAAIAQSRPGAGGLDLGPKPDLTNEIPEEQEGVEVTERLGEYVPLELSFFDSTGDLITLGDAFVDNRPVILALVYYDCPVVCAVVMGKLTEAFRGIDFDIGDEYNVVFASIDPSEKPPLAASVKDRYVAMYDRPGSPAASGWKFLTSPDGSAEILADRVGWAYKPVAGGEYSHPVAIFVLTPEGRIARYVYGVGYDPDTMRMALLEASDGEISESIGDMILMFCFRYDPITGKYSLAAYRVVQLGGVLAILGVGTLIGVMLLKERVRRRRSARLGLGPASGVAAGGDAARAESRATPVSGSTA